MAARLQLSENVFLKPSVKLEPLIWRWYAWPHLIPPLNAGCNIAERHLKIMQSYVVNPKIHQQAVKDPKMLGGPFIDLDGKFIDEIKQLITKTNEDCHDLIKLASAYKNFSNQLQSVAQGDSLESRYELIPEELKGMVELTYDLNNNVQIRLIEPLLYKKYYQPHSQSILISDTLVDERKFVLSTPYIDYKDQVELFVPFSDERIDFLFKLKSQPQPFRQIIDLFREHDSDLFQSFFTASSPDLAQDRNYEGEGIRVRYFGHACVLIETKKISILLDPVISYPINDNSFDRFSFLDLPDKIDYVLITHNHQDHILFESLLQLRHKIGTIVVPKNQIGFLPDPSLKLVLENLRFNVIERGEFETIKIPEGEIITLPFFGEHSDLNIQSKLSFLVNIKGSKLCFAADSNNLDVNLYNNIYQFYTKEIDYLFLGMECDGAPLTWLYGPLLSKPLKHLFDKNRSLSGSDCKKAFALVEALKPKVVNVYAMGQEPWLKYIMALEYTEDSYQLQQALKFVQLCKTNNIQSEILYGRKEWIIEN